MSNDGADTRRIDRRAAMKAALGGVAAATVWSAPRIEGLSIAPDVAQAASCTGGTLFLPPAPPLQGTRFNAGTNYGRWCWSAIYPSPNSNNNCASRNDTVTIGDFTVSVNFGGFAELHAPDTLFPTSPGFSDNNGGITIRVNGGIDPPYRACTLAFDTARTGCTLNNPAGATTTFWSQLQRPNADQNNGSGNATQTVTRGGTDYFLFFGCNQPNGSTRDDVNLASVFSTLNVTCICANTPFPDQIPNDPPLPEFD